MEESVCVDLSGTLHIQDVAIPGAKEALKKLLLLANDERLKIRYVTNTTKENTNDLLTQLRTLGFTGITEQQLFSSPVATRRYLEANNLRPLLLVDPKLKTDFEGLRQEDPNCVVVGLAPSQMHYERLNEAFRLLMSGAVLVAMHKAKYYARQDGLALGPGAFVAALEFASGVSSKVIGKPSKEFFNTAITDMNVLPDRCFMIGDDIEQDYRGAKQAGMIPILVRTGKYRPADEQPDADGLCPTVVDNFAAAVEYIIEHINRQ
eukprot:GILK01005379.1.p1 GENE.GILK01005379.1~~GILK01005379.1.p1  ORF type:complete len:281 (-),score=43.95 GILK01005379.1:42-830(-)